MPEIPELVRDEAVRLSPRGGDDCTVLLALCRPGQVVNILTGPPQAAAQDWQVASRFLKSKGLKIVCGGTTAEIVARTLGQAVRVDEDGESLVAPPRYEIKGVDLVTEGVVTLNQVYNLLDEPLDRLTEDSGVTELCAFLQTADRVNIIFGGAQNRSSGDISFRQQGILTRERILPLIADKLRTAESSWSSSGCRDTRSPTVGSATTVTCTLRTTALAKAIEGGRIDKTFGRAAFSQGRAGACAAAPNMWQVKFEIGWVFCRE